VTGASSGIGKATAEFLAAEGFRVFGTSRKSQADANGVEMLELDVRREDSVERCMGEVRARADHLDVLVNNAGIERIGIAEETGLEDARAVFETNFFGVVRMTNAVLPEMRRRGRGRIVNVGSAAAWVGEPGEAFYAASKHALAGYSEALRYEVRPLGIHVCLIEPGSFRTNIVTASAAPERKIPDYDAVRAAARRTLEDSARKGGDPRAVAKVISRVVRARAPHLRYPAGRAARWIPYLKVLLPQRAFESLVRRGFGLPQE
jgi:NAD(P)-dependent dehydrogenase (short-subunit alcohol dehydrogenase family)